MAARPTGTVTFLFTDVEGSTALWEARPDEMAVALERHDAILRTAIDTHEGYVFSTAGDAFAAAFARVEDAVAAAQHAQDELAAATWPTDTVIKVRMGLHTGEAHERDGDYFGPALNRAARIMSAGHGGQILVSAATAAVRGEDGLRDLGSHRLKDLGAEQRVYQVGDGHFATLRSLGATEHDSSVDRAPRIGRAGEVTELFERDDDLRLLHGALARARDGRGELVLVSAQAGSGKTTLLTEFQRQAAGRPLFLEGACDPVSTPRPLGPLIDAVGAIDPDLALRLAGGTNRAEAFAVAQSLIDGSRSDGATVLTIEDLHWADEATLDLITFLGRRIRRTPSLLVLTFRDDEIDVGHPLRPRLGELAASIGTRIELGPLSRDSVAALVDKAGADMDIDELHRTTGGNPFFVTEILGSRSGQLPVSVREAVLARAERLPSHARAVLDAAAVVPGRVDRWLLDAMTPAVDTTAGLEICTQRGLVDIDVERTVGFRHELARTGIASALAADRRRALHERAFGALLAPPTGALDHARLAHHAAEAEIGDGVLTHAPLAAVAASQLGSTREAERHYSAAISFADALDPADRAELFLGRARERATLSRPADALADLEIVHDLFDSIGDVDRVAETLVRFSPVLSALGRHPEGIEAVDRAAALVAGRPASLAQAEVATYRATNHMLARQFEKCEEEAQRALELAEAVGADTLLAEACIQTGIALAISGDDAGLERVRRGMAMAEQHGADGLVALGLMQIGSGYGELRRYEIALPALRDGIEYADAREMPAILQYLMAWLGRCELEVGNWDAAATHAREVLEMPSGEVHSRLVALVTLAWVRARRGDPDVADLLDEALGYARSSGLLQRLWPVAACRAEVAWMDDRLGDEVELLRDAHALATEVQWPPAIEELSHWLSLADGVTRGAVSSAGTPFGLSAAGRSDLAATGWAELGCPYEEALALIASEHTEATTRALDILERLGAEPMRRRVASMLRDAGHQVPRGPTASSRRNPHDLTEREMEVLAALTSGGTNREIGERLGIATKTVGHHVSSILRKLEVTTRTEASVAAARLGIGTPGEA